MPSADEQASHVRGNESYECNRACNRYGNGCKGTRASQQQQPKPPEWNPDAF